MPHVKNTKWYTTVMKIDLTSIAAWFGAFGTVFLFFFEVYKYFKDKPIIKLSVRFNQQIYDELAGRLGRNKEIGDVWTVNIANTWKLPITVRSLAVENHKGKNALVTIDALKNPIRSIKLEPGSSFDVVISEEMLKPSKVKKVIVTSAVGTQYKKRIFFWMKK